jgi:uracil phosphoribosyltransferase
MRGIAAENVQLMALVAAPEGLQVFFDHHPGIHVYVASWPSTICR